LIDIRAEGAQEGPLPNGKEVPETLLDTHGQEPFLVFTQPYFFKSRHCGTLLAWFSIRDFFAQFVGADHGEKNPMALAFEDQWAFLDKDLESFVPSRDLPSPSSLGVRSFHAMNAALPEKHPWEIRAYRIPIQASPFSLVTFLPTVQDPGASPNVMITVAGSIGTILLLGAAALFRAESRQRLLNARFRAIFDNAGVAICLLGREGRILQANGRFASYFGCTQAALDRLHLAELAHPEDLLGVRDFQEKVFENEAVVEHRFLSRSGTELWGKISTTLIKDGSGHVDAVVAILIDLTESKQAERERLLMETQLRQAQKMEAVGQLAAGIAHEINTPVQFIGDNASFLFDAFRAFQSFWSALNGALKALGPSPAIVDGLEKARQAADLDFLEAEAPKAILQIQDGARRVSQIVHAMKDFSHPGGGSAQPADLNRAIEDTTIVSRNSWKYEADLVLDLDPGLPMVTCFLGEMNQVILNLILNAIDAIVEAKGRSEKKGTISISTRRLEGQVVIRVKDTGAGIPETVRSRIFEPFFTTKDVGKGTGQGLAIAYHVVVGKHQGSFTFETEPGQGTTFEIRIPIRGPGGPPFS
jgi:PAS domain S-box-containing protein